MPARPSCNRCGGARTVYYKHTFPGGYHVGLHCWTCKTHAESGRAWYPREWFKQEELDGMPKQAELASDPRQGDLF